MTAEKELPSHVLPFVDKSATGAAAIEAEKPDEPAQSAQPVKPPDELSADARKWWDHFIEQSDGLRRFTQADMQGIAMLAENCAEFWKLNKLIVGFLDNDDMKSYWIKVSARSSCQKSIERLLKEFGLTWKARGSA